jgi:hypothetical protein
VVYFLGVRSRSGDGWGFGCGMRLPSLSLGSWPWGLNSELCALWVLEWLQDGSSSEFCVVERMISFSGRDRFGPAVRGVYWDKFCINTAGRFTDKRIKRIFYPTTHIKWVFILNSKPTCSICFPPASPLCRTSFCCGTKNEDCGSRRWPRSLGRHVVYHVGW